MKNLLTIKIIMLAAFLAVSSTSYALDVDNLLTKVSPKPSSGRAGDPGGIYPQIKEVENYKAESNPDYKGRNENITKTTTNEQVKDSSTLTKTVTDRRINDSSQIDALESTAGEMVDKVESDRLVKSKVYEVDLRDSRDEATDAYLITKKIDAKRLGKEQDPEIKNAFKCSDLDNCKTGGFEKHEVLECDDTEMLHWTGHKWDCVGIFSNPKSPSCASDQYAKNTGNGTACVDYIYQWDLKNWGTCDKGTGLQQAIYVCYERKVPGSGGKVVSDNKCKHIGDKPTGQQKCIN
jgi:hypothetical protein